MRDKYPVILDEDGSIPISELRRTLIGAVKQSIEYKKFDMFTYQYEVSDIKFYCNATRIS